MNDAPSTSTIAPLAQRSALDWILFATLTVMWAGAYALTRVAVEKNDPDVGLPVEWVLSGRLTVGAVVLIALMYAFGQRLPGLRERSKWIAIFGMALVGSVFPFYLITTAQQTVDSSLAALYTSAAPIMVAVAAHFLFADERLSSRKGIGVMVGFAGVAVLFGPSALQGIGSATVIAQIMLIFATACYSSSSLLARGSPSMPPLTFAAGFISVAAIITWPMALSVDPATVQADWVHWAAVIGLGAGPSAVAQALYMLLVRRAGAGFMSLTGYSIPIVSAGMGWIFFRETQSWNAVLAFLLILTGVWLAQRRAKPKG